jgi:predicted thioredoxin/glutaredoxin
VRYVAESEVIGVVPDHAIVPNEDLKIEANELQWTELSETLEVIVPTTFADGTFVVLDCLQPDNDTFAVSVVVVEREDRLGENDTVPVTSTQVIEPSAVTGAAAPETSFGIVMPNAKSVAAVVTMTTNFRIRRDLTCELPETPARAFIILPLRSRSVKSHQTP